MLPNRIVLIVALLVYHTRTTLPLWRPYYDRYPLTITDRVRYYRLAYVIQKYALSVILISFCVFHTNVPGYHNHLCNLVTFSVTSRVGGRLKLTRTTSAQTFRHLRGSVLPYSLAWSEVRMGDLDILTDRFKLVVSVAGTRSPFLWHIHYKLQI